MSADVLDIADDVTASFNRAAVEAVLATRPKEFTYLRQGDAVPPGETKPVLVVVMNRAPKTTEEAAAALGCMGFAFRRHENSFYLMSTGIEVVVVSDQSWLGQKVK